MTFCLLMIVRTIQGKDPTHSSPSNSANQLSPEPVWPTATSIFIMLKSCFHFVHFHTYTCKSANPLQSYVKVLLYLKCNWADKQIINWIQFSTEIHCIICSYKTRTSKQVTTSCFSFYLKIKTKHACLLTFFQLN